MTENSYAANGVKHCVRPCDMSGKSAAVILRQMHDQVVVNIVISRNKLQSMMNTSIFLRGYPLCLRIQEQSASQSKRDEKPSKF
jgi:hypothetical protein